MNWSEQDWTTEAKRRYRSDCIIAFYRQHLASQIPQERQYWTLCGLNDRSGCEFDQITSSGLVKPGQFFGVDNGQEVITKNRVAYPDANWIVGDFVAVLNEHKDFRPAIMHIDTVGMADRGLDTCRGVLPLVCIPDTLVVVNIVAKRWFDTGDIDDARILDRLNIVCPAGWSLFNEHYTYCNKGTTMLAILLIYEG